MSAHYKIRTEKTGHFFMHGSVTDQTRYVWICLHGYGGLGKYFIRHFEFLDPAQNLVIVPEGMNRFYIDEQHERAAAHWMTREDRLDEIADYVDFLESLRTKLSWDKNPAHKIIYVGFSQGVSTLIRWLNVIHPRADYIQLWAGRLPEDILYDHSRAYFEKSKIHFFIGDQDEYINESERNNIDSLITNTGIKPELHVFPGDHRIHDEVLRGWVAKMISEN